MGTARATATVLVLLLCGCFCLTELAEVDFFWHLLAGQRILVEHQVPRVDTFTFTSAGRPWVDLHWLFQALVAWVYGRAGWGGLDLVKVGLITGGFACACLAGLRRTRSTTVAALALVGVVAAQERFTLRPEAASFFLLGLLLLILQYRREHPRLLVSVPLLIALWANLHALYAVGLALLVLVLAGDVLESFRSRRDAPGRTVWRPCRPLLLAAAASLPASLLTPFALQGWILPGRLLFKRIATGNLYGRTIAEFQAPFGGFGPTVAVAAFAGLAAIVVVSLVVARRRVSLSDGFVLAAFLALALLARRNMPLFALVCLSCGTPAVDAALRAGWERAARIWRGRQEAPASSEPVLAVLVGVAALLLTVDVVSNRFFARDGTQRQFGRGPAPGFYPEQAAGLLERQTVGGEVLNDMTMGGYLAWRWFPRRRVFIDGRLEVHDAGLYASYLSVQQNPDTFETVARRYGIGAVLWSHRHSTDAAPLLRHLARSDDWRPVFVDLAAVLFVREPPPDVSAETLPAIDLDDPRLAARLLTQADEARRRGRRDDPLPGVLRWLVPRREVPAAVVGAALTFGILDRFVVAERLFRAALAEAPDNAVLHYDIGVVLQAAGRPGEAQRSFEEALRLDRGLTAARAALALILWRTGDEEGALREWGAAERRGRLPATSLHARGTLYARRGRVDEAIADFREALRMTPGRAGLRADLALLYYRRGLKEQARAEVRRALAADPVACVPRVASARLSAADGDPGAAEKSYRAALEADPGCTAAHVGLAALLAAGGRGDEALREVVEALRLGAVPAALSAEPSLRTLLEHPEVREVLSHRTGVEEEGR